MTSKPQNIDRFVSKRSNLSTTTFRGNTTTHIRGSQCYTFNGFRPSVICGLSENVRTLVDRHAQRANSMDQRPASQGVDAAISPVAAVFVPCQGTNVGGARVLSDFANSNPESGLPDPFLQQF